MAGLTHSGRGLLFGTPGLRTPTVREGRIAAQGTGFSALGMSGSELPTRHVGDHLFAVVAAETTAGDGSGAVAGWTQLEFDDIGPALAGLYHRVATNDAGDNFSYARTQAPIPGDINTVQNAVYMISVPPFGAITYTTSVPQRTVDGSAGASPTVGYIQPITAPAAGYDVVIALTTVWKGAGAGAPFMAKDPGVPPGTFLLVPNSLDRDSYAPLPEQADCVGATFMRACPAGSLGASSSTEPAIGTNHVNAVWTYRFTMTP